MIFVTVGNATQPYRRLLNGVEALVKKGVLDPASVLIQYGHDSGFRSARCRAVPFLAVDEFEAVIQDAELVIAHAGAGTLLHLLAAGALPVVMPRRKQYGEHVDDHQVELVEALAREGRVVSAHEPDELEGAIRKARAAGGRIGPAAEPPSRKLIGRTIEELMSST